MGENPHEAPWGPNQSIEDDWIDLGYDWLLQHGPVDRPFTSQDYMVESLKNHPGVVEARTRYAAGERPGDGFVYDFGPEGYARAWAELDGTGHFLGSYKTDITDNGDGTVTVSVKNRSGRASFTNLRIPGKSGSLEILVEQGNWLDAISLRWRTVLKDQDRPNVYWGGNYGQEYIWIEPAP